MPRRTRTLKLLLLLLLSYVLYTLWSRRLPPPTPLDPWTLPTSQIAHQATLLASTPPQHGLVAQALLELFDPGFSIFARRPFQNGHISIPAHETHALLHAQRHIRLGNVTALHKELSAADTAALGVAALLLDAEWGDQARADAEWMVARAPRFLNGAISHTRGVKEAWAEFVYMVPPFLAYVSVDTGNRTYMDEAVRQCRLYHDMLARKPPGLRLWRHVLGPLNGDDGAWSIGNGFAAAGLARMIATLGAWEGGKGMVSAKKDMVGWVKGIVEGVKGVDESSGAENGLLRNYVDDESWFGEVAGTALMASAVFRMAVLEPRVFERYVEWAERKAEAVRRHTNPDTGIAAPAVQELNSMVREPIGTGSAEGQSFVMLLYAARRDYIRWQKGEM